MGKWERERRKAAYDTMMHSGFVLLRHSSAFGERMATVL